MCPGPLASHGPAHGSPAGPREGSAGRRPRTRSLVRSVSNSLSSSPALSSLCLFNLSTCKLHVHIEPTILRGCDRGAAQGRARHRVMANRGLSETGDAGARRARGPARTGNAGRTSSTVLGSHTSSSSSVPFQHAAMARCHATLTRHHTVDQQPATRGPVLEPLSHIAVSDGP